MLYPIFLLVIVSFDPTSYTVTEGIDGTAELMLVRSGNLNEGVAVSVTTESGTAAGMAEWDIYLYLRRVANISCQCNYTCTC